MKTYNLRIEGFRTKEEAAGLRAHIDYMCEIRKEQTMVIEEVTR